VAGPTHYDTLGVDRDATATQIREAYRSLAREHHPDRATGVESGRMHDINEAYRVLSDPARRAVYDGHLRQTPTREEPDPGYPIDPRPPTGRPLLEPPNMPWRTLGVAGLLAIIGVFVLSFFTEPSEPAPPDGILRNGDCVEIEPDNDAREIPCTGEGDLIVRAFVSFEGTCPNGTEPHRDRQGMGVACIERPR
jgi:molecular chaperone DnaJ